MLLIYDGDCGFCTACALWLDKRLPDSVRVAAAHELTLSDYGLIRTDLAEAAYWVDDEGRLHRGHQAIGRSLIAVGRAWTPLGHMMVHPPGSWMARPVYRWVGRNRHRLPGGTAQCRNDSAAPK